MGLVISKLEYLSNKDFLLQESRKFIGFNTTPLLSENLLYCLAE